MQLKDFSKTIDGSTVSDAVCSQKAYTPMAKMVNETLFRTLESVASGIW